MIKSFPKVPCLHAVIAIILFPIFSNAEESVETITVTAQKREQAINEVGISISTLSSRQIKSAELSDSTEISQQIPGLQVNTWSPTLTTFNLRGVSQNNFTDNLEAPVAVYSDEVYIGSMNALNAQLFDVKRIEVLRGPQGTLFGRNATGGLIHYISQDASAKAVNGYFESTFSDYNTRSLEGAVGGSVSENVRARFAGRWEKGDGYVKATVPGVRDIGGRNGYSARGSIQVDFTKNLTGDFSIKYSEDSDVATGGYTVYAQGGAAVDALTGLALNDGTLERPFEHDSEYQGYFDRKTTSYTGKLAWLLSNEIDLVVISNYTELEKFYTEDGDAFPVLAVNFTTIADYQQFSHEMRLNGEDSNSRWQVGAYYLQMDNINQTIVSGIPSTTSACLKGVIALPSFPGSSCFDFAPGGVGAPVGIAIPDGSSAVQDADINTVNKSIFGQYEYDIDDEFTFIFGYRWSEDDKKIKFNSAYVNNTTVTNPVELFNAKTSLAAAGLSDNDKIDYGDYATRVQLDWRIQDELLIFASYNRGIKGGNWSVNSKVKAESFRHDPETLHAFELGLKKTIADFGHVHASSFYYDYQDYQAFALTDLAAQVSNSDATIKGAEIELFLSPNQQWDLLFGASFVDSKWQRFLMPTAA